MTGIVLRSKLECSNCGFTEELDIPVVLAEDPLTCVARGGGHALENIQSAGELLSSG